MAGEDKKSRRHFFKRANEDFRLRPYRLRRCLEALNVVFCRGHFDRIFICQTALPPLIFQPAKIRTISRTDSPDL